jgi:methanogenic corrinoid protein MtbC1
MTILTQLATCIEKGKADRNTPFPPELVGQDGATELTTQALEAGIEPQSILNDGMMPAMRRLGERFSRGEAFIPELLIAARAMNAAMELLKPYFESGQTEHTGKIVLGTVSGDLHDIGKNLVRMILEGAGWHVIDLGVDVPPEKFAIAVRENPGSIVGLSAMLTTTMLNMEKCIQQIHQVVPGTRVFVGGAPLSEEFAAQIGADGYFADPNLFSKFLSGR